MNKPEKKEYPTMCDWDEEISERGGNCPDTCNNCMLGYEKGKVEAHNQTCIDWEVYLPDKSSISSIISYNVKCNFKEREDLAKAIHNRIHKGEK